MIEHLTISTDPELLAKQVNPDKLSVPGNFFVTDALNFYEDLALVPDSSGIDDRTTYDLRELRVGGELVPRPTKFISIEGDEHEGTAFAVMVGSPDSTEYSKSSPMVRVHSACGFSEVGREMTAKLYDDPRWAYDHREELLPLFVPYGDEGMAMGYPTSDYYFQTSDCDCQGQRRDAQWLISRVGGIYISLAGAQHEGRGYGPELKEKAYQLQDELGVNTKEAFDLLHLYPYDIRQYGHVVAFLRELGLSRVALMSNNPLKITALELGGIAVDRIECLPEVSSAAERYVNTKMKEFGHLDIS